MVMRSPLAIWGPAPRSLVLRWASAGCGLRSSRFHIRLSGRNTSPPPVLAQHIGRQYAGLPRRRWRGISQMRERALADQVRHAGQWMS